MILIYQYANLIPIGNNENRTELLNFVNKQPNVLFLKIGQVLDSEYTNKLKDNGIVNTINIPKNLLA